MKKQTEIPLSYKEIVLARMRERKAAIQKQFQPRAIGNGHLVRDRVSKLKPEDFAIMQKIDRHTNASHLLKRFYKFNAGDVQPQGHKYIHRKHTYDDASMMVFAYYLGYVVFITRGDNDQHFARIYWDDNVKKHHIATAMLHAPIFNSIPSLQKRLTLLIKQRKFKTAMHQLDKEIPI